MIKPNTKVSVLADHEHPLKSANTQVVAASRAIGGDISPQGYLNSVGVDHLGRPRRTVVWTLEDREIEFEPFAGEKISQQEFIKRWNDKAWIEANPTHPIAYIKAYQIQLSWLRDQIRDTDPTLEIKGARGTAFINKGDSKEVKDKLSKAIQ